MKARELIAWAVLSVPLLFAVPACQSLMQPSPQGGTIEDPATGEERPRTVADDTADSVVGTVSTLFPAAAPIAAILGIMARGAIGVVQRKDPPAPTPA